MPPQEHRTTARHAAVAAVSRHQFDIVLFKQKRLDLITQKFQLLLRQTF